MWYNYNGIAGLPTEERGVGTLAADLEKVAPYMIKPFEYTDSQGIVSTYKSVDYNAMLFMFVNAFKEQQKEIDDLEADNKRIMEAISAGR